VRRPALLACALVGALAGPAPLLAQPSADQASAHTALEALALDPFADRPLSELETLFKRGPGLAALRTELETRSRRLGGAEMIVLGRFDVLHGRRADGLKSLGAAVTLTHDPVVLRKLARILDDNGARVDAIRAYAGGLAGASPLERRGLELRLGALYLAEGKSKEALATWEDAKRGAPTDQALRRQIAEALASRGLVKEAIAELRQIEPLLANEPQALIALERREADFARRIGDRNLTTDALLRAYLASLKLKRNTVRAELTLDLLRWFGADHHGPDRQKNLKQLYQLAQRAEAQEPAAAGLEGDVLAALDNRPAAVAAFHRALSASPGDPYVLFRLCALEEGAARLASLEKLFDIDRNDATVAIQLIAALLDATQPQRAVERARLVATRFADSPFVLAEAAQLLAKHGQHTEAVGLYERILRLEPDQPDMIIAYGDQLRVVGRTADAERAYFRLVARDRSLTSYRALIQVLSQRDLATELKRAYREALLQSPEAHPVRRDYARWLSSQGAFDEAIGEWKVIQAKTNDPFLRDFSVREIKRIEAQKLLGR
jgi:tetratricopeptide (TPR) repeat protein